MIVVVNVVICFDMNNIFLEEICHPLCCCWCLRQYSLGVMKLNQCSECKALAHKNSGVRDVE